MKIVLAFDSFKGSLSAREVCDIVRDGIASVRPEIEIVILPMADGGEGTAEAMRSALGGEWVSLQVMGPLRSMRVKAGFVWLEKEKTAVVEMATASGLPLLKPEERNPMEATTFGTGELMKAAIEQGAETILLTLGGSATVDGGIGAAEALGWTIDLDRGVLEPPVSFEMPEVDVLCDVINPLCGPNGAAQVYGPQKGATQDMVDALDVKLLRLSDLIFRCLEKEVREVPGAGAAGGLAAGAMAFMNGELVQGVDAVMETIGLADALQGADWVLTGEGCFDSQSIQGKVVDGVARVAETAGAKTGVIAGAIRLDETVWRAAGVDRTLALKSPGMSMDEAISRSRELLFDQAAAFAYDL